MIVELELELLNRDSFMWRKIHIHDGTTLEDLHKIIQLLFDWWDEHPYRFRFLFDDRVLDIESDAAAIKLRDVFDESMKPLIYIYGKDEVSIRVLRHDVHTKYGVYPVCIDANMIKGDDRIDRAGSFPFGMQKVNHDDAVKQINARLSHHFGQRTLEELNIDPAGVWEELVVLTEQYYEMKPWKHISNEQVIAIYAERFDEYIFCSVLGDHHDLYGLSVYVGFDGLLALHMSLTKKLTIDQLFQIHSNILLRFEKKKRHDAHSHNQRHASYEMDNEILAQYTSYKSGRFPWHIDEKEAELMKLALKEMLHLHKRVASGFQLPNYVKDESVLLRKIKESELDPSESIVPCKQLMKKILPLNMTLSKTDLRRLQVAKRLPYVEVEFSLQYVNVPIQRLKNNRPFFPLSIVVADRNEGKILYHDIYDERLDYEIVQRELLHMIDLLNGIPGKIMTDHLTYQYVKPLLLYIRLPLHVTEHLQAASDVNYNISKYLISSVE